LQRRHTLNDGIFQVALDWSLDLTRFSLNPIDTSSALHFDVCEPLT
jgi:hypothetical protein